MFSPLISLPDGFAITTVQKTSCILSSDPKSKIPDEASFFARREFSFTLENDIYLRYQYCSDAKELKDKVVKYNPNKIDIGAVFFSTVNSTWLNWRIA